MKTKIGIVGASGYAGIEIVKLIARHPNVELGCVTSRSLAGTLVADNMPSLRHLLPEGLTFEQSTPAGVASMSDIDVWFLALPHGAAAEYARALVDAGKKVLDLSADFRLHSLDIYKEYYKQDHNAPELLKLGKYVIAELFPVSKEDKLIACAGCYPTSILLPLIPLMREKAVSTEHIVINSYSGVSGAGKKSDLAYAYCERNESAKAYGLPKHRHNSEIEEELSIAAGQDVVVQFNPHLCPMNRGISTTITVPAKFEGVEKIYEIWNKYYAGKPFVKILKSGSFPDTAHVCGTNRCDISAVYDVRTKNLVICSVIDNIVKGASGQAVQIMNLLMGFDETAGLL
ncbi:MAG: N-acetyl-gamma-glutamyl-phosphate reductase [Verrucomicrobiaceae bacterium]|nr:N-acetyl-gamma-glutamyl-phosphate reductase [Verrucomicrobiaceae bacterium]